MRRALLAVLTATSATCLLATLTLSFGLIGLLAGVALFSGLGASVLALMVDD